jgi:hypothetical protein
MSDEVTIQHADDSSVITAYVQSVAFYNKFRKKINRGVLQRPSSAMACQKSPAVSSMGDEAHPQEFEQHARPVLQETSEKSASNTQGPPPRGQKESRRCVGNRILSQPSPARIL